MFKPKNGVREKLRETLHNVLAVEMAERSKEVKFEEEGVTSSPNAVTISKNTRYAALSTAGYDITAGYDLHDNTDVTLQTVKCLILYQFTFYLLFRVEENRQREPSRNFVSRARKLSTSNEVSRDSNK